MKWLHRKSPSSERRRYFIWCHPEWDVEYRTWKRATAWTRLHALAYKKSGLVYPRNIFSNKAKQPLTEVEKFLLKVDHAMISAVNTRKYDPMIMFGKWLIYVDRKDSDSTWEVITREIESGKLPYRAKISTAKENSYLKDKPRSKHMICVYTPNFLWRENVREVRRILNESGFMAKMYYKPDIFSVLEIGRTKETYFDRAILKHFTKLGLSELIVNHRYFG